VDTSEQQWIPVNSSVRLWDGDELVELGEVLGGPQRDSKGRHTRNKSSIKEQSWDELLSSESEVQHKCSLAKEIGRATGAGGCFPSRPSRTEPRSGSGALCSPKQGVRS